MCYLDRYWVSHMFRSAELGSMHEIYVSIKSLLPSLMNLADCHPFRAVCRPAMHEIRNTTLHAHHNILCGVGFSCTTYSLLAL